MKPAGRQPVATLFIGRGMPLVNWWTRWAASPERGVTHAGDLEMVADVGIVSGTRLRRRPGGLRPSRAPKGDNILRSRLRGDQCHKPAAAAATPGALRSSTLRARRPLSLFLTSRAASARNSGAYGGFVSAIVDTPCTSILPSPWCPLKRGNSIRDGVLSSAAGQYCSPEGARRSRLGGEAPWDA